eukprot:scaffold5368_cov206-Alexandrium_tamarense.AAC.4
MGANLPLIRCLQRPIGSNQDHPLLDLSPLHKRHDQQQPIDPSVTVIPDIEFYGRSRLVEVELCDGLQTIDDGAFIGCSSLQSILIPSIVEEILFMAFDGCT